MKRIAVLLTVFNRKEQTLLCLQRLQDQPSPEEFKIVTYLTNDGCTDGTPEAVRREFPDVHIINGDGNLFWNRGIKAMPENSDLRSLFSDQVEKTDIQRHDKKFLL